MKFTDTYQTGLMQSLLIYPDDISSDVQSRCLIYTRDYVVVTQGRKKSRKKKRS